MYIILTGTSSRKKEGKTKKKDKSETEINGEVIYMVNLAQVTRYETDVFQNKLVLPFLSVM
jgi:hypothetical protein